MMCSMGTDKAATAVLAQGSGLCVMKTHHDGGASWFVSQRNELEQLEFTQPSILSEMATVEELVQMMKTLQGQQRALKSRALEVDI